MITDSHKVNVRAVIDAYQSGKLEIRKGLVTIWVNGHKKTDYISEVSLLSRYYETLEEFRRTEPDGGNVWVEEVSVLKSHKTACDTHANSSSFNISSLQS
jgi:hypothetical protein